jgi:endo-1,4-beta-xylanase
LDVNDTKLAGDINLRDRYVAAAYEDYLSVVLDEPAVIAVITFGLSDRAYLANRISPSRWFASPSPAT